ncbi:MAG: PAS domain S-box protein [Bermanella sp.]
MRLKTNGNDEISNAYLEFNLMASELENLKYVTNSHNQEQRDILNFLVDAVVTINQQGIILSINKSAEKLFGYLPEEVINKNVNMLMPSPYHAEHNGYLEHFLNTNEAHIIGTGREVTALSKQNTFIPIRLSVAEIPPALDGSRRFIGSCIDLTYEKKQEEEKRRSQKLLGLGNLAGGIAHDFNNLLAIINGYSELLSEQKDIQRESKGYLAEITMAGERGHSLTKRLLAFSRGKMVDNESCNINTLIQDNKNNLHNSLSTNNELILNLEDKIWNIQADPSEFIDAILNIIINAKHAMSPPGVLTLTNKNLTLEKPQAHQFHLQPGDYVELCITDTGIGMDEQTIEQLFDPFFSTKGDAGTGLGLSQVYGFVKRVDAHMRVNSTLGEGSAFCIYFPRHLETNEKKIDSSASIDQGYNIKEAKTILVVDDEPSLSQLASHFLIQAGYNTLTANSAEQALNMLEDKTVELILSDVIMGGMNGYELYRQVKKKYPDIKFLLASGFDEENKVTHDEINLQMKRLHKPYLKKDLINRVMEALNTLA